MDGTTSGKKRAPKRQAARRTVGDGVPETRRKGPVTAEERARPQRGRQPGSSRLIVRPRTARARDGV